jgi:protein-disulfide isomerase
MLKIAFQSEKDIPMKLFIKLGVGFFLFTLVSIANAGVVAGNPSGNVTLTEFFDYNCPACKTMGPVIQQLINNNPQLRVVYRPLPLLGPNARFPVQSALAAERQKKFLVLHAALLNANQPLTQEAVLNIANQAGVNTQHLLRDMKNPVLEQDIRSNLQAAHNSKIRYLPTLIVTFNSSKITPKIFYGRTSLAQLQTAVQNPSSLK